MIPKMNSEMEIFQYVKEKLLTQNQRSMSGGDCAYRGNGGLKCAVGHLISDEFYDKSMEGKCAGETCIVDAICKSVQIESVNPVFLGMLQIIHDNYMPDEWVDQLADFERKLINNEV